jgi:hypothetical protein
MWTVREKALVALCIVSTVVVISDTSVEMTWLKWGGIATFLLSLFAIFFVRRNTGTVRPNHDGTYARNDALHFLAILGGVVSLDGGGPDSGGDGGDSGNA